ncbi:gamma-glutamyltransferase family protein [Jiangella ureilytica]|uniref:Gamma-glutamyltransferase family protein n=1 Tax=Jiangella ureilytica TaxID=2530374 RepID=A0A4R4RF27_9ACTN|nr:gamma-glutamyltransferase [Jiangella ureilytica]TDC47887.1 gamma-glutamyltransferase family protein [Jiangella ureilytica]
MTTFTTRPELTGTHGMVASTHWLASQAGMSVLERGGNAFDAAVAAGLVLQVVEPEMNGPGGDLPVVGWDAAAGEPFVVCGQGVAPAAATSAAVRDLGVEVVPGTGLLPAVVPGAFGGWMLLLQRYGTMRPRDVMSYAIEYAGGGFPLGASAARVIGESAAWFRTHWPTSAALWLRGAAGAAPGAGDRFVNAELAATYERIVAEAEAGSGDRDEQIERARRAYYEGFVAEALTAFAATEVMDESGAAHRGLLTAGDLAAWRATVEDPVAYDYHGHTVLKAGPWSQGPVFLQQLALLDAAGLGSAEPDGADFVHLVVESAKLAFADREAFYGDPAFAEVPLAALLAPSYAQERARLVDAAAADTGPLRPGRPAGREPRLPRPPSAVAQPLGSGSGEPTWAGTHGDTCHLDVADRWGNVVSCTPSGGWLQSSPAVPGLGFGLGTRGQMFWLEDGLPNSLAPGKRPRTTLTPSLVLRPDGSRLAFGTPGGDQQDQWSLLFLLRLVHHGHGLQQAIDAPAWHTTHFTSSFYPRGSEPGALYIEGRVGERVLQGLRARGHRVTVEDDWSLGRVSAAGHEPGGFLRAAANPRGMQGYAVGR